MTMSIKQYDYFMYLKYNGTFEQQRHAVYELSYMDAIDDKLRHFHQPSARIKESLDILRTWTTEARTGIRNITLRRKQ